MSLPVSMFGFIMGHLKLRYFLVEIIGIFRC